MNHITRLEVTVTAQAAEIASLRESLDGLRALMHSSKFAVEPYVNVSDIILWAQQASQAATDANVNSEYNENGPKPIPTFSGWACPVCGTVLQDSPIWNDSDAKSEGRMRDHWRMSHKTV